MKYYEINVNTPAVVYKLSTLLSSRYRGFFHQI